MHRVFAVIGSDSTIYEDATTMLYAPGFKNSNYVGFDLSEEVVTIYSDNELYSSPSEFVKQLPLTLGEITAYRKTKEECRKLAAKVRRSRKVTPNQTSQQSTELDEKERAKLWVDSLVRALKDETCTGEEYRLWQGKITGNPKRRKQYKWLKINSTKGVLPKFYSDRDSWLSAATYYSMWKGKGYIASINCNFLIIKWERWHWLDRIQKVVYDNDPYCSKFNQDWELMQRELYRKFWDLGVDLKKGATAMFSMPGSMNTTKKLKTDDRFIREIHKGVTVNSYREIQRIHGEIIGNDLATFRAT